ncbi:MAG TPA: condensation domain-containing protein [Vicinamibacterales bacterium]|nr:condensation domain-containing protein [Vicinamibacterales bacterium]
MSGLSLDDKTALLKALLERRHGPESDLHPLSSGQHALWLLYRQAPGDAAYNVISTQIVHGVADVALLQEAFQHVIDRHELLRATFTEVAGVPYYRSTPRRVEAQIVNCSGSEDDVRKHVAAIARTPIDLEAGPVSRLYVITPAADSVMVVLLFHHIVMDAWSLDIVGAELMQAYADALKGRLQGAPLRMAFRDFVRYEQTVLSGARGGRLRDYWTKQLGPQPPVLNEPLDFPRTRRPRLGDAYALALPPRVAADVYELARRAAVTPFVVLLAAYALLLARYGGQTDVVIGCPVALRNNPAFVSVVGYLVNMIGLRIDVSGALTFAGLLARVKGTVDAGMAHADYPFSHLVKDLDHPSDSLASPVFQAAFNLLKRVPARVAEDGLQEGSLAATAHETLQGTGQFDLVLELTDRADSFDGHLKYDAALFRRDTAARLARNYVRLLGYVSQRPDEDLRQCAGASVEEERQIAVWSGRAPSEGVVAASARSLIDLFERQCAASPNATALVDGEVSHTYADLDRRAVEVAAAFEKKNTLVGVPAEASADAIIRILGILKAGCAYVAGGGDRLDFDAAGLACVVFTSGTTGSPKAVPVEHGSAMAMLSALEKGAPAAGHRSGMALSPLTSASSLWEVFGMLCVGGVLHIPGQAQSDPRALAAFVKRSGITDAFIPSAMAKDLPEAFRGTPGSVPLRRILLGGEALSPHWLRRWREIAPEASIRFGYAAAETTFMATAYSLDSAREPIFAAPIGTPLEGYRVQIVDEDLRSVPIGAIGEILIDGPGVCRECPPSPMPGARRYRSGDLGRWLPDGNIELVGGVPSTLAAVLEDDPGVASCHVAFMDDPGNGPRRVVAFVKLVDPASASAELAERLRQRALPFMQPRSFKADQIVFVAGIPRNRHGKVDRRKLDALLASAASSRRERVTQNEDIERRLLRILESVLGRSGLRPTDDFFALGGTSLLAVRIRFLVEKELGVSVPMAVLFDSATVEDLAARIAGGTPSPEPSAIPRLARISYRK